VRRRWYLVAAGVATLWGTVPLVARQVNVPPVAIAFSRTSIAAVALGLVLAVGRGRGLTAGPRLLSERAGRCVLTAVTLGVHWLALFAAYDRAPAGTVILIVYLAPIGVALAAPALLGEHAHSRTFVALAVAVAGLALLAGPAASSAGWTGLGLALVAMVTFVALVLLSKPLADIYGGLRLAFMEMAGAGVVLLPLAATASWGSPRGTWFWLLLLGLVHTALGLTLSLAALGRVPATHVAIIGYLEPAAVVLFAWLLLAETPSVASMLGGVLVLIAGGLIVTIPAAEEVTVARG
jgi:drug/metabolite transporter (DMT)-like permease